MRIRFKYSITVILFAFLSIAACETEGPTGPQGPQGPIGDSGVAGEQGPEGPQGPAGEDGQDGQDGADGEDGNANVIYSDWFYPDWNELDAARVKRMSVSDSDFSSARSNGVILFYWTTNNGSTFLLPWNNYNAAGALVISRMANVRGASGTAWIDIRKYGADFTPTETEGQVGGITYNRIRYVIIPGGVPAKMGDNFFEDYNFVKEYYGIPD